MKAVILERKGGEAAVLAENGTFMKVRHSGEVGEEIEIAAPIPMMRITQRWIKGLAAAAIVLAVAGGAYHYSAVSVSAYVSVSAGGDQVEFSLNRLGRVVSVTALGDNSQAVESIKSDINGMKIEEAVPAALAILEEEGGLSAQQDIVIVGITADSESRSESLESAIIKNVDMPVRTIMVSEEERQQAHRQEQNGAIYVPEREKAEEDDSDYIETSETQLVIPFTTSQQSEVYSIIPPEEKPEETPGTIPPAPDITENNPGITDAEPKKEGSVPVFAAPSETEGTNTSDIPPQQIMPAITQNGDNKPAAESTERDEQPPMQEDSTAAPQDMQPGENPADNGMTPPEPGERQPENAPPQDMPQMQDMQPSEQPGSPGNMEPPEQQGQSGIGTGEQPPDRAAPPDRQLINAPAGNENKSEINS